MGTSARRACVDKGRWKNSGCAAKWNRATRYYTDWDLRREGKGRVAGRGMPGRRLREADLRTNYNFTKGNDWNAEGNNRHCWGDAQMGNLAEAASGFVLAIGMGVRRNLQKEREREQRQRERYWPGESAEDGMYVKQHFRASRE